MTHESYLSAWQQSQELAESMQPLIGKLYRNQGVETCVYARPLLNASTIDILKAHRVVRRHEGQPLPVSQSYPVLKALSEMELAPASIDLGKLAVRYWKEHQDESGLAEFLKAELAPALNSNADAKPTDVVLYGFGRIGRLLARLLIERAGSNNGMRLRGIVVRGSGDDLEKRASLLRRDSVHGPFNGSIEVDAENNAIIANGTYIQVIYANSPEEIDYTQYGIHDALVVDNTGKWRDEAGLGLHLKAKGAAKVLLTAPGKGDIKNIVFGVNDHMIDAEDRIMSAASCTTNAITPVLKAVSDTYGVKNGHVETVHSYTNDQNLIDNYHKGDRRGRSAALNMVLTSTGAASAVAKALPELKGKLTGNAIRVPTPNVSMAVLNLNLEKATTAEELNDYLLQVSLDSPLHNQIDFSTSSELVSTDMVGSRFAGIVDSLATIVDGDRAVLYVWYDNEFGYSCQVVRVMQKMAGIELMDLPARG
ncbi:glyceraldehyde-3-phosphate dehydrogenase [Oceanimonas doudoroffii]|uniref:Glyceraldehyde-3-phosphate dehydrogenase n=1 Tax=Oceanimonas doudoroffii TaxID=84158 RepID=A0A233REZ2_9GAMM|nr:glyceraldehyde-3-phosphate dehydrogenase [Oceanimonas doudoroffii]OXY81961.1 type I glyceraldehyde-3-phosphate dehydrogenase [Oceanimonas doudoroffii]